MNLRPVIFALAVLAAPAALLGQAPGHFPPDSLINVKVIPKSTPVMQVVGIMRNFAGGLGVRCQFCHVGQEGMPLGQFDFAKDEKRTKLTARQMMRMVDEINRRLDTLPEHAQMTSHVEVTCNTCHRGVSRPMSLEQLIQEAAQTAGLSRPARALLRPRGLRLRRADAEHLGVPIGAGGQVHRGVRDSTAQRGAVPDVVEPRDVPGQHRSHERRHSGGDRGVPRGGAPRLHQRRGSGQITAAYSTVTFLILSSFGNCRARYFSPSMCIRI